MRPVIHSDYFGGDDQDVSALEDPSGENGVDPQIAADLYRIDVLAFVPKDRTSGDHSQRPELSKVVDQGLTDAVGEVLRIG